jgi:3-hydroxybutyryl-CoA dehydrogenase
MNTPFKTVGIVGAGAMGRGIAQLAAQTGAQVLLFDLNAQSALDAQKSIESQWEKLKQKDKITDAQLTAYASCLRPVKEIAELASCDLIVEAVVEILKVKQDLFTQLESLVSKDCVLTSNTSSLSITSIAKVLQHPERFAGFHFFNPVPLMKVVEVVRALKSAPQVLQRLTEFTTSFGHTPIIAEDTPGFVVNHAGRAYGTEALRVVSEGVSDFATIDRILKDQVGFKLGPFELFDLTALDVSHPVMESIYNQYYQEPRYRPNYITAQRLAAGVVGKKVGEGFYKYKDGICDFPPEPALTNTSTLPLEQLPPVWVSARAARRAALYQLLKDLGVKIETALEPSPQALCLVAPLGFDVTTACILERLDPARTVGIDMLFDDQETRRRVIATNPALRQDMRQAAEVVFTLDGKALSVIRDSGGFVTQRVVACIVNIASDICQQQICTPSDLDLAVRLGLGYPKGPLALGNHLGAENILEVLFNLQTVYADPRYRPSPWLRRRGALGLSLLHVEA